MCSMFEAVLIDIVSYLHALPGCRKRNLIIISSQKYLITYNMTMQIFHHDNLGIFFYNMMRKYLLGIHVSRF